MSQHLAILSQQHLPYPNLRPHNNISRDLTQALIPVNITCKCLFSYPMIPRCVTESRCSRMAKRTMPRNENCYGSCKYTCKCKFQHEGRDSQHDTLDTTRFIYIKRVVASLYYTGSVYRRLKNNRDVTRNPSVRLLECPRPRHLHFLQPY